MATFRPVWSSVSTLRTTAALNNAASLNDDLDLAGDQGFEGELEDEIIIGSGSPSGVVTIELFRSGDDGTSFDTEPFFTKTIPFTTTATKRWTTAGIRGAVVRRTITNSTGENATLTSKYRYLQQESA